MSNELSDLEYGFHNSDGWYFRRDSDAGTVRLWKVRWQDGAAVLEAGPHLIPENEWASIVASVSRGGEMGTSWQFVRDFHNGGCKRD